MRPAYLYFIVLAFLTLFQIIGDKTFKLQHSDDEVYRVKNLRINDSVLVDDAVVFIGCNVFGVQEAILLPPPGKTGFDYMYVRFSPESFEQYFKPQMLQKAVATKSQAKSARDLHKKYLTRMSHLNDFPMIVKNGEIIGLESKAGKVTDFPNRRSPL